MRVYQGKMIRGDRYICSRTRKPQRFSRIVRMHADEREDIDSAEAGDIVAVVGLDCVSGDTFCSEDASYTMESMHIMDPVISLAVSPAKTADRDKFSKALSRFSKEDPTFHVSSDPDTGETLISGMGELHLEIYCERIRRGPQVELTVSQLKVSYRNRRRRASCITTNTGSKPAAPVNTPTSSADWNSYRRITRPATNLRTRYTAAASRPSTSRRWTKASTPCSPRVRSPASRSPV
jgi:translation elongation factor EF-G